MDNYSIIVSGVKYNVITRDPIKVRGKTLWNTRYKAITETLEGQLELSGNITSNTYPPQEQIIRLVKKEIMSERDLMNREQYRRL